MTAIPLSGDRSAKDAENYPLLHTNDTDTSASSIHHTLGTGALQAAIGNHSHSGSGISIQLDDLSDVSASSPNDGDAAIWNDTSGSWISSSIIGTVLAGIFAIPVTEPPDISSLTWVNQDSSASAVKSDNIIWLSDVTPNAQEMRLLVKSLPDVPYTVELIIVPPAIQYDYSRCGVAWRDSSGSGIIVLQFMDSFRDIVLQKYYDEHSWNEDYSIPFIYPTPSVLIVRLEDDNTDRKIWLSSDGRNWTLLHSVGRTDYITADQYGICIEATSHDIGMSCVSWKEN